LSMVAVAAGPVNRHCDCEGAGKESWKWPDGLRMTFGNR
jgi:hypothetical protein